jgi:hypothetical protein
VLHNYRDRQSYGTWTVQLVGPEANRVVLFTRRDACSHERGWEPTLGDRFEQGLLNVEETAYV